MNNFFAELKRRNVYKVAVAYAVVGWLLSRLRGVIALANGRSVQNPSTHLINRKGVRCQRFGAAARREKGEYPV
jgi:hypothetical protein